MRVKCIICGRGAEFPPASARRCLTFPHSVYSSHLFSSRSFSSPTRCMGFADSPPVDYDIAEAQYCHGELLTPPQFRFMVSVTRFPTVRERILDFVELCNIFVYCRAKYFRVRPLTNACLPLFHARWREKYFLHFIEL